MKQRNRLIGLLAATLIVAVVAAMRAIQGPTKAITPTAAAQNVKRTPTAQRRPDIGGVPGDVQEPAAVSFELDPRPMMFQNPVVGNIRPPKWRAGDVDFMVELLNIGDHDRVVIRQPGGGAPGEVVSFANWFTMTAETRAAIPIAIERWKSAKQNRRVGVFFRRDAGDPFHTSNRFHVALDPSDPRAWRWFVQNCQPWFDVGVDEVWLDGGSGPIENRPTIVKLARRVRSQFGVKVGVEAIPATEDLTALDLDFLAEVPAMGSWRYIWSFMIRRGHEWRVPPGLEVHVYLLQGWPRWPDRDYPTPTTGDIAYLKSLGFIVGHVNGVQDYPEGPRHDPSWRPPDDDQGEPGAGPAPDRGRDDDGVAGGVSRVDLGRSDVGHTKPSDGRDGGPVGSDLDADRGATRGRRRPSGE